MGEGADHPQAGARRGEADRGCAADQVFDVDVHGFSTCWYTRPVALVMLRPRRRSGPDAT
jgi:hypothetical protein